MTKKVSVWLAVGMVIAAVTVTFLCTLLLGGSLVHASDSVPVAEAITTAVAAEKEVTPSDITARVSSKIAELAYYYSKYYVGDIDVDDLVEGAAEGFVAYSGDKYGQYHTKEEYKLLKDEYSGSFCGIGVSVVYNSNYGAIEILNVIKDSPALESGLLPDDLIIKVDGEDVAFLGYNEALARVRGEEGTTVTLTIARGDKYSEIFNVTLTRRPIIEQTVVYSEIETDFLSKPIAHISITSFNDQTPEQFKEAIGDGLTNKVHGYVIDLRNNGGGTLSSVVSMLDMLLPEGPIVRIQYKDGTETVYESGKSSFNQPIVLLINGNTASAAELFTAALRDYGKAFIVGENSYGKGTVQQIISLRDGSALRLSTSMYAPPFSDNFEGKGVAPDITVSLADEYKRTNLFNLAIENDAQLQAALNLFK